MPHQLASRHWDTAADRRTVEDMAPDAQRPAVEVVALVASAGGLAALSVVLADLPTEFRVPVVVQQHLGSGYISVLPTILGMRTRHRVGWARDGQLLMPGEVIVCPPGMDMVLLPDGSCCLRTLDGIGVRRFDVLLASIAGSYGKRGVAVVLSGSSCDGAAGTAAMKRAGAVVIAQSPDTAAYPSMPIAAARAGAALVLPVDEIGRVLTDITEGKPFSRLSDDHMTAAQGDSPALLAPKGNATGAAERAQIARRRAAELRRRRQDLAAGFGATEQTVATAQLRAEESLRRAQLAQQVAAKHAATIADSALVQHVQQ
jgi:hypothetical protein